MSGARRHAGANVAAATWRGVGTFFHEVVGRPLRRGRLTPSQWPLTLQLLGVVAAVVVLAGAAYLVLAERTRRGATLLEVSPGTYLPDTTLGYLSIAVFVSLTLLEVAALHLHIGLRLLALLLALGVFAGQLDVTQPAGTAIAMAGWVALVAVFALARRGFRAWQVLAVGACVFVGMQGSMVQALQGQEFGLDLRAVYLTGMLPYLAALAVPSLIVAGAALTQVSVLAGTSLGNLASQGRRPVTLAVLGLLVVWRFVDIAVGARSESLQIWLAQALGSLVVVAGTGLIAWPFINRAMRHGGTPQATPSSMVERFAWLSFALALPIAVWLLGSMVQRAIVAAMSSLLGDGFVGLDLLAATADNAIAPSLVRTLSGLVGLAVAWHWASRGRWASALILAAFTMTQVVVLAAQGAPSSLPVSVGADGLGLWLAIAVVGATAWLAWRGRLQGERVAALVVAAAIMFCYDNRAILANPINALLGFSVVATLLFGLIWRGLTDGEFTRGDSASMPRNSRVLLYLASLTFATTSLVYGALTRDASSVTDIAVWESFGDQTFAPALYLAAVLYMVWVAVRPGYESAFPQSAPRSMARSSGV